MSSPQPRGRSWRTRAVASIALVLSAWGCSRETIGLGLVPDASLPMPSSTSGETVPPAREPHMDAGTPRSGPTASSTAPRPPEPSAWLPHPIRVGEADAQPRPPKIDRPAPDADAGTLCRRKEDCIDDPATPNCRLDTGKCVRCLFDSNCPSALPRCDPITNECGCMTAADCRLTGACDPLTHQCLIGCSAMAPLCAPWAPYCDMNRGVCLQCSDDMDCHGKTFVGVLTELCKNGLCVQCREEADCADFKYHHCAVRDGACVECVSSDHCAAGQQCFEQHCVLAPPNP